MELSPAEYEALMRSPVVDESIAGDDATPVVVVTGAPAEIPPPGALPMVIVVVGETTGGPGAGHADVVVAEHDLDRLLARIHAAPIAATSLAVLLRTTPVAVTEAGLAAESAVYSMLQGGPEFARWRSTEHPGDVHDEASAVAVERQDGRLRVVLDRPHRHNAISTRLRDDLYAALQLAVLDPSITEVELRGRGRSFCSGGDLAEFGSRPDPGTAHVVRLARSPARLLDRLADRVSVYIHGVTLGGGIELAAFAGRVVADPDTEIGLPELRLGLMPGAGGTVSIPRRIGRQRAAFLALSTEPIDAGTALEWGLVDAVQTLPSTGP